MTELGAAARAHDLAQLLLGKKPDGTWALDDRVALAALALMALGVARADPAFEPPRFLMEKIGAFVVEAKLEKAAPAERAAGLENFLLSILPAALRADIERFYREELAAGAGAEQAQRIADALGMTPKAGPLDSGARPKGTTAAGPLARFQLGKK